MASLAPKQSTQPPPTAATAVTAVVPPAAPAAPMPGIMAPAPVSAPQAIPTAADPDYDPVASQAPMFSDSSASRLVPEVMRAAETGDGAAKVLNAGLGFADRMQALQALLLQNTLASLDDIARVVLAPLPSGLAAERIGEERQLRTLAVQRLGLYQKMRVRADAGERAMGERANLLLTNLAGKITDPALADPIRRALQ